VNADGFELRVATRWPDFDAWPNVLVHVSIDYRREIVRGVREVAIRTRIAAVGGSSVRFEQTVLAPDGEVAAEAEAVLVAWDPANRRSRAITDGERATLTA
jgi:acyl-CoA thioesterase FadM